MPAIQPSRLKAQTSQLIERVGQPANFLHDLHGLLDFYADRTRRPSGVSGTIHLLHEYNAPKPVLRSIEQALMPKIDDQPDAALVLADALWEKSWAEFRLLAIFILGQVPAKPPAQILDRIAHWGAACKEATIMQALATRGMENLRHQAAADFFQSLEIWITTSEHPLLQVGLGALPTLIADDNFENLPLLFRWLAPLMRNADIEFRGHLSAITRAMALKAPQETTHFLRQVLMSSANAQTAAIIRQALDVFPPAIQTDLQEAMRRPKA